MWFFWLSSYLYAPDTEINSHNAPMPWDRWCSDSGMGYIVRSLRPVLSVADARLAPKLN